MIFHDKRFEKGHINVAITKTVIGMYNRGKGVSVVVILNNNRFNKAVR